MTALIESTDEFPEPRRWSDLAAELGYDSASFEQGDDEDGDASANADDAF
jgi:hypothetical protein